MTRVKSEQNPDHELHKIEPELGTRDRPFRGTTYENTMLEEFNTEIEEIIHSFNSLYDAAKEAPPTLAMYHPSFKNAEQASERIGSRVVECFATSDQETQRIAEDFDENRIVSYHNCQKLGLIGDSRIGTLSSQTHPAIS